MRFSPQVRGSLLRPAHEAAGPGALLVAAVPRPEDEEDEADDDDDDDDDGRSAGAEDDPEVAAAAAAAARARAAGAKGGGQLLPPPLPTTLVVASRSRLLEVLSPRPPPSQFPSFLCPHHWGKKKKVEGTTCFGAVFVFFWGEGVIGAGVARCGRSVTRRRGPAPPLSSGELVTPPPLPLPQVLAFRSPPVGGRPLVFVLYSGYHHSFATASPTHLMTWDARTGALQRCFTARQLLGGGDAAGGGGGDGDDDAGAGGAAAELSCGCLDDRGRRLVLGESAGRLAVVEYATGQRVKRLDPHGPGAGGFPAPVLWAAYGFKTAVSGSAGADAALQVR